MSLRHAQPSARSTFDSVVARKSLVSRGVRSALNSRPEASGGAGAFASEKIEYVDQISTRPAIPIGFGKQKARPA
jgi:hypothetical protein